MDKTLWYLFHLDIQQIILRNGDLHLYATCYRPVRVLYWYQRQDSVV